MAFTVNKVDFIKGKTYTEITHSEALERGLPNFIGDGYRITGNQLTGGYGINGGLPFIYGKTNESETISTTDYLILKTTISGATSQSELINSTVELANTSTIKYFTLFKFAGGIVEQDYTRINYIDSLKFIDNGDETFSLILNGFKSEPFSKSFVAANDLFYTKLETDELLSNYYTKTEVDEKIQVLEIDVPDSPLKNGVIIPLQLPCTPNKILSTTFTFMEYVNSVPRNSGFLDTIEIPGNPGNTIRGNYVYYNLDQMSEFKAFTFRPKVGSSTNEYEIIGNSGVDTNNNNYNCWLKFVTIVYKN